MKSIFMRRLVAQNLLPHRQQPKNATDKRSINLIIQKESGVFYYKQHIGQLETGRKIKSQVNILYREINPKFIDIKKMVLLLDKMTR